MQNVRRGHYELAVEAPVGLLVAAAFGAGRGDLTRHGRRGFSLPPSGQTQQRPEESPGRSTRPARSRSWRPPAKAGVRRLVLASTMAVSTARVRSPRTTPGGGHGGVSRLARRHTAPQELSAELTGRHYSVERMRLERLLGLAHLRHAPLEVLRSAPSAPRFQGSAMPEADEDVWAARGRGGAFHELSGCRSVLTRTPALLATAEGGTAVHGVPTAAAWEQH